MNPRAKVYTSDPPTLVSYFRQLLRWHTDFWLVVRKHRSIFGKRVFGTVALPITVLNNVASSVLFLGLPVYFLLFHPSRLLFFLFVCTTVDSVTAIVAHHRYRRVAVYWSVLSRYPTRFAARLAFLIAMTQVLAGRPDKTWSKSRPTTPARPTP